MAIHQRRLEKPLQPINHRRAPHPIIMVSSQPPLRLLRHVVLFHVVLVRGEDEGAVFFEVDLHNAQAGCVARRMMQGDALRKV